MSPSSQRSAIHSLGLYTLAVASVLLLNGCTDDTTAPNDEGTTPSATHSASATHTASSQPSVSATGIPSTSASGGPDTGDGGRTDSGAGDSAVGDSAVGDSAVGDSGEADAGATDSGSAASDASGGSVLDAGADAGATAPGFEEVQTYFLDLGCGAGSSGPPRPGALACHGSSAAGGLSLVGADALDALLNVESPAFSGEIRVIPGDPDNSLLMKKLTNNLTLNDGGTLGAPMPAGEAIQWHEPDGVELVRRWIAAGARP
jgi:hypothetical protein